MECLSPKLLVKQGNKDCADIVIFNRDTDDEYISFEEGGEWDKILEANEEIGVSDDRR